MLEQRSRFMQRGLFQGFATASALSMERSVLGRALRMKTFKPGK